MFRVDKLVRSVRIFAPSTDSLNRATTWPPYVTVRMKYWTRGQEEFAPKLYQCYLYSKSVVELYTFPVYSGPPEREKKERNELYRSGGSSQLRAAPAFRLSSPGP